MQTAQNEEEILKAYEQQCETIMEQMVDVLNRAQGKVDDAAYKKILEKLERETS